MAIQVDSSTARPGFASRKRMSIPDFVPTATMVGLVLLLQTGAIYVAIGLAGGLQAAVTIAVALVALICVVFPNDCALARRSPRLLLAALLAYVVLISVQLALVPASSFDMYIMRVKYAIFAASGILVVANVRSLGSVLMAVRVAVAIAVLCNLADFAVPAVRSLLTSFHPSKALYLGRAAGLFANPNFSAAAIAAGTAVGAVGLRRPLRLGFYAVSLVGIFVTYSRGGILLWLASVMMAEFIPIDVSKGSRLKPIAGLLLGAACAALFVLVAQQFIPALNESLYSLTTEDTRSRLTTLQDGSARERLYLIQYGLAQFGQSPIWGNGVGYGYTWELRAPVHNVYVLMLVEHGLLGALWLAFFIYATFKLPRPIGIWLAAFLLLKGLFNHNVFNELTDALGIVAFWTAALFASEQSGRMR
ncbi:O-antigen ligase family protein [Caulobacter sp. 17J65-9]|uniref:O-antigen ligase family protein n=1 Tax=Caulobacter sp. 17J65-9 TaxID=2709382 RepID=UPI0013C5D8B1|nr:O-antigen ligase family protein [Caulobacter sp. 17J65-9]NEX94404.1 O-antigen ligase family protein [Caulobacter sp. 17J65-9]